MSCFGASCPKIAAPAPLSSGASISTVVGAASEATASGAAGVSGATGVGSERMIMVLGPWLSAALKGSVKGSDPGSAALIAAATASAALSAIPAAALAAPKIAAAPATSVTAAAAVALAVAAAVTAVAAAAAAAALAAWAASNSLRVSRIMVCGRNSSGKRTPISWALCSASWTLSSLFFCLRFLAPVLTGSLTPGVMYLGPSSSSSVSSSD